MKGQTRDPKHLERNISKTMGMLKTRTNNYPESGRGLGHVAPTISIDFVGVPWPAPNIGRFPHTTLEKLLNK